MGGMSAVISCFLACVVAVMLCVRMATVGELNKVQCVLLAGTAQHMYFVGRPKRRGASPLRGFRGSPLPCDCACRRPLRHCKPLPLLEMGSVTAVAVVERSRIGAFGDFTWSAEQRGAAHAQEVRVCAATAPAICSWDVACFFGIFYFWCICGA
ncbi:retrotransposon hot spot (RHS) protein, partial [Trypanosoma cruzi]